MNCLAVLFHERQGINGSRARERGEGIEVDLLVCDWPFVLFLDLNIFCGSAVMKEWIFRSDNQGSNESRARNSRPLFSAL